MFFFFSLISLALVVVGSSSGVCSCFSSWFSFYQFLYFDFLFWFRFFFPVLCLYIGERGICCRQTERIVRFVSSLSSSFSWLSKSFSLKSDFMGVSFSNSHVPSSLYYTITTSFSFAFAVCFYFVFFFLLLHWKGEGMRKNTQQQQIPAATLFFFFLFFFFCWKFNSCCCFSFF